MCSTKIPKVSKCSATMLAIKLFKSRKNNTFLNTILNYFFSNFFINTVDPIVNQAALHKCAAENNQIMTKFILTELEKVNPNVQDNLGRTPLMIAAEFGNYEIVKILIHGTSKTNHADAIQTDHLGRDVFCYATLDTTDPQ